MLENICRSFGSRKVLDGFSRCFEEGRVNVLTGPSGWGKTTLLNIIAGILKPDSGSVSGTEGRKMAYVFQTPDLLPWKTVLANVEFVLPKGMAAEEKSRRAMECLEIVELADRAESLPAELSLGMAMRVSLARALAADSDILLLDEPFSGIDPALKERLLDRLQRLWAARGTTVVLVSHSKEALFSDSH